MKRSVACLIAALWLSFTACSDNNSGALAGGAQPLPTTPVFRSISPQEARALMAQRPEMELIDLRDPRELSEGAIPGSKLVPFMEIARGNLTLPADRPLLLICAVGGRSYAVGQYFYRRGYPEIYNLKGGISAWKQAALPLNYQ